MWPLILSSQNDDVNVMITVVKIEDELLRECINTKIKFLRRVVLSTINIYFIFSHFVEAKGEMMYREEK